MLFLLMNEIYLQLPHTSALYIFIKPELTLSQVFTELIPHNTLECSAKGPVFILKTKEVKGQKNMGNTVQLIIFEIKFWLSIALSMITLMQGNCQLSIKKKC